MHSVFVLRLCQKISIDVTQRNSVFDEYFAFVPYDQITKRKEAIETFLKYTGKHWPDHFREVPVLNRDGAVINRMLRLYNIEEEKLRDLWWRKWCQIWVDGIRMPRSALCIAAMLGHTEVLKWMLLSSASSRINIPDINGHTALSQACLYGHENIAKLLLGRGAKHNSKFGVCDNPLSAASWGGHERIVKLLVEHGAHVDIACKWRQCQTSVYEGSALCMAAEQGHEQVVRLLLKEGASINLIGCEWGTALNAAVRMSREDIVRILLENGAAVNVKGSRGTAFDLLKNNLGGPDKDRIELMLRQKRADQEVTNLLKQKRVLQEDTETPGATMESQDRWSGLRSRSEK